MIVDSIFGNLGHREDAPHFFPPRSPRDRSAGSRDGETKLALANASSNYFLFAAAVFFATAFFAAATFLVTDFFAAATFLVTDFFAAATFFFADFFAVLANVILLLIESGESTRVSIVIQLVS